MTFFIYCDRKRSCHVLSNGDSVEMEFSSEGAAGDFAVRIAQENNQLWTINYWKPF